MNRHARRAAAAIARRGRPPGYVARLLRALSTQHGVHYAAIEHKPGCAHYRTGRYRDCDCTPDISVSSPDGAVVIDELGTARKVVRQ
jgi:hypothetical protein